MSAEIVMMEVDHCAPPPSNSLSSQNATNTAEFEEVGEILSNMMRQESTTYRRVNYLDRAHPTDSVSSEPIDGSWRQYVKYDCVHNFFLCTSRYRSTVSSLFLAAAFHSQQP
jgi:hypothetical protein